MSWITGIPGFLSALLQCDPEHCQNDQRCPSRDEQQQLLDPPQLIIYPATVQPQNTPDSPQQISNNDGDGGVSLHFSSAAAAVGGQQLSSPAMGGNSVVLLSEGEHHADQTATTFRLFYQFSPTKQQQQQQQQEEGEEEGVKPEVIFDRSNTWGERDMKDSITKINIKWQGWGRGEEYLG